MGQMLVYTNAVEGRDEEFNRWYDEIHLPEVLALPEFTRASRMRRPTRTISAGTGPPARVLLAPSGVREGSNL